MKHSSSISSAAVFPKPLPSLKQNKEVTSLKGVKGSKGKFLKTPPRKITPSKKDLEVKNLAKTALLASPGIGKPNSKKKPFTIRKDSRLPKVRLQSPSQELSASPKLEFLPPKPTEETPSDNSLLKPETLAKALTLGEKLAACFKFIAHRNAQKEASDFFATCESALAPGGGADLWAEASLSLITAHAEMAKPGLTPLERIHTVFNFLIHGLKTGSGILAVIFAGARLFGKALPAWYLPLIVAMAIPALIKSEVHAALDLYEAKKVLSKIEGAIVQFEESTQLSPENLEVGTLKTQFKEAQKLLEESLQAISKLQDKESSKSIELCALVVNKTALEHFEQLQKDFKSLATQKITLTKNNYQYLTGQAVQALRAWRGNVHLAYEIIPAIFFNALYRVGISFLGIAELETLKTFSDVYFASSSFWQEIRATPSSSQSVPK